MILPSPSHYRNWPADTKLEEERTLDTSLLIGACQLIGLAIPFFAHFRFLDEKRHWTHFLFLFPLGLEPFTPTNLIHNGPELGANKSHQSARPEYVCHHIYPQWQKDITKMSQKLPNCSALLNIREFWGQKVAEPMQSPLSCICPRATLCRKQEDLKRKKHTQITKNPKSAI